MSAETGTSRASSRLQSVSTRILAVLLLAVAAAAADEARPCLTATSRECEVSAAALRQAQKLFRRGLKLHRGGKGAEALAAFSAAAELVPRNVEFATARELERQNLVLDHVSRGNRFKEQARGVEAQAEYSAALALDPTNAFAATQNQQLEARPVAEQALLRRVAESLPDRLAPKPGPREFHLRGDTASILRQVLSAYGIDVVVDPAISSKPMHFDIGDADFADVLAALERTTHTFVVPRGVRSAHVFADTADNRRDNERLVLETFYLPEATKPEQLNDIVNAFRALLDVRFMSVAQGAQAITLRAPQRTIDVAAQWLEQLQQGPPQVMLDVRFYEVTNSALRDLGIALPTQFQMFNLTAGALALSGGGNVQDLINQLFSSGGINQANAQALQGLLGQLQNQQNSIFKTPFATFGGGLTRMAISVSPATVRALATSSKVATLEHLTLRAQQGNAATFTVGSRYPILNATFAPIFNTAAISQVIQNNSFQAPFPSFNYENLGVTLKATPEIHASGDITLKLEMEIKTLTGQAFNGVPVISTRNYNGTITVMNGESSFVAGSMTRSEQRSVTGIPGLGKLPAAGRLFSTEHKESADDELLISITPRIISQPRGAAEPIMIAR